MLRFDAVPEPVRAMLTRLAGAEALVDFALGGGTSLALRFGHRRSVDLDFFTQERFSAESLFETLALEPATVTGLAANSLTVDAGGVKLDFLRHSYDALAPVEHIEGLTLVSLPDLAAMKLNAIANRGSKKDFFDLAELLKHFTMQKMLGFYGRKYPSTDPFTVIRSLAWFQDAESEPDPVALNGLTWGEAMKSAREAVAGL
jgi:hypothetical protein